jgi:hypothetical protein
MQGVLADEGAQAEGQQQQHEDERMQSVEQAFPHDDDEQQQERQQYEQQADEEDDRYDDREYSNVAGEGEDAHADDEPQQPPAGDDAYGSHSQQVRGVPCSR